MGKFVWVFLMLANVCFAGDPILQWGSPNPGVTYRMYMSRVPGAQANAIETVDMGQDRQALLPELQVGEPRFFCVTAFMGGLESECSREVGYIKPFVRVSPITGGVMFYFHRIPEAPGNLRYTLEVSEDLKTWTDEYPVEPKTAMKNGVEVFWIELPQFAAPKLFGRIRVEEIQEPK